MWQTPDYLPDSGQRGLHHNRPQASRDGLLLFRLFYPKRSSCFFFTSLSERNHNQVRGWSRDHQQFYRFLSKKSRRKDEEIPNRNSLLLFQVGRTVLHDSPPPPYRYAGGFFHLRIPTKIDEREPLCHSGPH